MKLDVQLFAAARDAAQESPLTMELPEGATVADLRVELVRVHPELKSLANILLVSVNNQYAADSETLSAGDTIACFPPVSGG